MKILVLNGSPRTQSNTKKMAEAFAQGAQSAGHKVRIVDICKLQIAGCTGCEYCHGEGRGECIQKDDMTEIYALFREAEMFVLASPVYYHSLSGQLKCAVDRLYACAYPEIPEKMKKAAMILCSESDNVYEGAIYEYEQNFINFSGLEDMGVFTSHGGENGRPEKLEELRMFGASLL